MLPQQICDQLLRANKLAGLHPTQTTYRNKMGKIFTGDRKSESKRENEVTYEIIGASTSHRMICWKFSLTVISYAVS